MLKIVKKIVKWSLILFVAAVLLAMCAGPDENETDKKESTQVEEKVETKTAEELAKEEAEKAAREAEAKAKEEAARKAEEERKAQELATKKANAKTIPFAQLKKNADAHKGEYVKYTGEIVQIIEGDNIANIRLSVTKESYGYSFSDIVYIEYHSNTEFIDGDIVTIYGEVYGNYSYKSQIGAQISLPGILADEVIRAN